MDPETTLDGNAIAGLLREIFAREMTEVAGSCDGCGAVEALGAVKVHVRAPGVVVRCPHCTTVLLRVVRTNDRCLVDMRGLRWLELRD